jgi:hypothetical protein
MFDRCRFAVVIASRGDPERLRERQIERRWLDQQSHDLLEQQCVAVVVRLLIDGAQVLAIDLE